MTGGLGIGSAANVVGGLMQAVAASQAAQAQHTELKRELQRQQGFRNEALDTFQTGLDNRSAETAETQIQAGADKRNAAFEQVGRQQFGLGKQPNMSTRDQALYKLKGMSRARLGGYSDWGLDQWINNLRTQDQLNKISNFAGGTAQVFPYRMDDAQHSMDELAFWGNLISSIGGSAANWAQMFGGSPRAQRQGQQPFMGDVNVNPEVRNIA
jgi:hypothetical protein